MIKIDKKIEYALIVLKHFKNNPQELFSAKDISDKYNIPFDMVAKVMQIFSQKNILDVKYGNKGGYFLSCTNLEINLLDLSEMILGPLKITKCLKNGKCNVEDKCNIKSSIGNLNRRFLEMLKAVSIKEIIQS